ncbi:hypothetical protein WJX72_012016 [[Myrmecia] bisecta]|uniref:Cyclin N-terminal domain-containing protein n=1 Tax=[Myrmecia] bisecta TaxID=41462 RepID=A0AAW1PI84_9CHLO
MEVRHVDMGPTEAAELPTGRLYTREQLQNYTASRRDGLPWADELRKRNQICLLITLTGHQIQVPQTTIAAACNYAHRFFAPMSLQNSNFSVAAAALFLAGKVLETAKSVKEITTVMYRIRHRNDKAALDRLQDPAFFTMVKDSVVTAERSLLYVLELQLEVDNAYKQLMEAIDQLALKQVEGFVQKCWNFLNDSWFQIMCLQYPLRDIALGIIYLVCAMHKRPQPRNSHTGQLWYRERGLDHSQIEDIARQLLELLWHGPRKAPLPPISPQGAPAARPLLARCARTITKHARACGSNGNA